MSVITISRESGSEGNEIAQILCQRLGYRQFDKGMMLQLAKELGPDTPKVADTAENLPIKKSLFDRVWESLQSVLESGHESQQTISIETGKPLTVKQVQELILAAYNYGNMVIIGRGSQIVLANMPNVLHVRVVAPLEKRIRNWQAREGLAYKDTSKKVKERDSAHIAFVKNFFDTDIRDPELYDLLVNTNKLSPQDAADLIITALQHIQSPN